MSETMKGGRTSGKALQTTQEVFYDTFNIVISHCNNYHSSVFDILNIIIEFPLMILLFFACDVWEPDDSIMPKSCQFVNMTSKATTAQ